MKKILFCFLVCFVAQFSLAQFPSNPIIRNAPATYTDRVFLPTPIGKSDTIAEVLAALTAGAKNVLNYPGVIGDGTNDDTAGIKLAIADAGVNGNLFFPANKTFLVSSSISPLQGQTWWGYGSKIKRAAENKITFATPITTLAGVHTLTVASTNGFYVGMDCAVFNGGSYDPATHTITAMTATTISIGTDFTVAFAGGGTLISSCDIIKTPVPVVPNIRVFGFEIDGNQAQNASLQKWELNADIYFSTDYGIVKDCYVHDSQSEGIELGGLSVICTGNRIENTRGNGIHLFGTSNVRVTFNTVRHCNLSGTSTGHADGCIIASNSVDDCFIQNNVVEDAISGIGSFDSVDNSRVWITDNVITNFATTAMDIVLPDTLNVSELTIKGNKMYNAGTVSISNTATDSTSVYGPRNIIFSENIMYDTKMIATLCRNMTMANNIITNSGTTALLIQLTDVKDFLATGNQLIGGGYGVYMQSANLPSASTNNINVAINGNILRNQFNAGIRFQTPQAINCSAKNNTIIAQTGLVSASWDGILVKEDCTVEGNQIYAEAGLNGINMSPGATGGYARAIRNTVVVQSSMNSIKTAGGSTKNIILQNMVSKAITDSGAPGNLVADNQTIGEIPVTLKRIVVDKTSNYTITTNECGTVYGVNGAGSNITFTLPASPFVGLHYTFVTDNSTLRNIIVGTGTTVLIRQGASVTTATTGTVTMSTNYQTMRLVCVSSSLWVVEFLNTGTVTFS